MSDLKSVFLQFVGYFSWVAGTIYLGVLIGGKLPQGDSQTLGVLFCISVCYFLLQAGYVHSKLNRILEKIKERQEP